jgi:D-proline reductase (dithiol) PrdB
VNDIPFIYGWKFWYSNFCKKGAEVPGCCRIGAALRLVSNFSLWRVLMNKRRVYRSFVSYIDRSREYYAAQGYTQPYAWAHFQDVPFAPLRKLLSQCRVGLVTTAGRQDIEGASQGRNRELYAMPSDPEPAGIYTDHLFWDKKATHTDDLDSFLPLNRLAEVAAQGGIGSVSPRFYGAPTDYSQGRTVNEVAPQVLEWCRQDNVDAVILSGL